MKVWLYKARDVATAGEPRPDAEMTRAFAINDGVLCRSAYTRGDEHSAWIANVQYVEAGDILLLFFRQVTSQPAILFLGSFRVRDPGDARLNEECDLAIVKDEDLRARLQKAYGIPEGERVTGWLLEPATDVIAPGESDPEIAEFLSRRSSLVEYRRRLSFAAASSPEPIGNLGIRRIEVRGFRSLRHVSWEPGRLNVVIGPNGSGKSNLLRAFSLLQTSAHGDLGEAILGMGGIAPLLWDGQASEISWTVDTAPPGDNPTHGFAYDLRLKQLGSSSSFRVDREMLSRRSLGQEGQQPDLLLDRERAGSATHDSRSRRLLAQEGLVPEDGTLLSSVVAPFGDPMALRFQEALRGWSIYHDIRVDPLAPLRQAAVARVERRVSPDGQNLIPVLHTLYMGDLEFRRTADAAMSAAFGDDYVELVFPPAEDQRVQLRVRWRSLKTEQSAAALSDGTLRFLLLIAILATPAPGALIAIDEPEAGLHPGMFPIVADLALGASDRTQIVFTTHSPQLLDAFRQEPPTTTVARSVDGETQLAIIDGEELRKWLEEYSLGALFRSGELEGMV